MNKTNRKSDVEQQQRHETSFDISLPDGIVTQTAGVGFKAPDFRILLGRAFHGLDTIQCFWKVGVHQAEGGAHILGNGAERTQVSAEGNKICNRKQERGEQQRPMVVRSDEQRHDQEDERADHQVDAWAEHIVDLAHVIGGAGHGITDGLETMEGHALGEQGYI